MTKITDVFSVGNKVEWITIRQQGSIIDIQKHDGTIDEIQGTEALIKSRTFKRRRRVSLYELKVVT